MLVCVHSGSESDAVWETVRLAAILRVEHLVDDRLSLCLDAVNAAHRTREKVRNFVSN